MSGRLRLYKEKLEGYNRFHSIVKTIKMVTMAKFRQAQVRIKTRDYTLRYTEKAFSKPGQLVGDSLQAKTVYIPVMTNRGSCGALNSNVVKMIDSVASSRAYLMPLGKRGIESLSKLYPSSFRMGIINDMHEPMHFAYATYIWENAQQLCPEADRIHVIFHRCVSAASQKQCYYNIPAYDKWKEDLVDASSTENQKSRYLFANTLLNEDEQMIRDFYDFHATLAILNAVCENELSEQAARLVAVEGQLSNISALQQKTSSLYNKTRQSSITSSLIEIISAMTSLEGNAAKGVQRTNFWEGARMR
ncbi:ATP synthase F1 subunit gamma protein, putative [Leishmania panamensis]|uniref:ATP synthase F1 subunit gamma protein, putative n=3 Tax=Leishmania guyanensis species complex TaxID=38579 RepID=A0A088S9H4_LEIPA|nr:ATP synthase F1 subunit gamma protein, putative [Leishmania panamensis]AIN98286.1 ATP synthase F1 subunit gamma protein, putative [Leishmania panamensis]CCM15538.1 Putative ATP synthase F1 subunit gamma protein [Leishmania guyanensis]